MPSARRLLTAAAIAAVLAVPAPATTIIPVRDAKLVDHSPLVVQATVEARLQTVLERPVTDWLVEVERVVKGELGTSRIVVRMPGGRAADGSIRYVYGTPAFAPGLRTLLFLTPGADDTWSIVDFPQGAFLSVRTSRRELSVRDFSRVRVLGAPSARRERHRDSQRFADWIEDRAAGTRRPVDYFVRPRRGELRSIRAAFTLFLHNGTPLRWFQFDSGGSVTFRSHEDGQPGLAGGGATEVQRALAAWTNERTTPVRLGYGGLTDLVGGTDLSDGSNVILWNDPGEEMPGKFLCSEGGTLAHGGPRFAVKGTFDGRSFYRILEGDVVFNDGIECIAAVTNFSKFIEQVAAHEIGHTLGIAHSSENENEPSAVLREALMYFQAHLDNRGARLNSDDVAALQNLYRGSSGGGGGTTTKGCPAGTPPGTLCLLQGRFRVTATWQNQFDSSSGTAGAVPSTDFAGFLYFNDPGNLELAVKILDFGSEIKVFYSQLTNLRFTLSVTDSSTGRVKTYSNTPGECGAIDNNFLTGTATAASELDALVAPSIIGGKCVADATTLCLLNNRFAVTVDWRNQFDGSSGLGRPKPLSALTGAFSFGDPNNLELLIKTLDFGDHQLVLYGALSNLEYTIRVVEAASGRTKTYSNAAGTYCGGIDNNF